LRFATADPGVSNPIEIQQPTGAEPRPAAAWRRIAAGIYDVFPLLAIWMIVTFAVVGARGMQPVPPYTWWYELLLAACAFAYFGVSWRRGGQTLGMRAWKLAVVGDDGATVGWPRWLLRFAVMGVSLAAGLLGVLWGFVDPQRRMWHDLAARTRVIDRR
jgi:uncharacterized RDD family membrane protein YckC